MVSSALDINIDMKIKSDHDEKLFFFITGLPGSGTTLMSRVMNSINGISVLSDPIRSMVSTSMNGKLTEKSFEKSIGGFIDSYKNYIKSNSNEKIGGIKEIFSSIPSRVNKNVIGKFPESDFMIFILRNPLGNFNDWKRPTNYGKLKRNGNYKVFTTIYTQYIEYYEKMKREKPCFLIKYEDLCNNFSCEWLNKKFKGYLEFNGELSKLNPLLGMGDEEAKHSYTINNPYMGVENLSKTEIKNIKLLEEDYNNLI